MSTYELRKQFCAIARRNVGKVETSRNQGAWIRPLWGATNYPGGYEERQPYCAAGVAWTLREWLKLPEVLRAFGFRSEQAEKWRCKSASCYKATYSWLNWAETLGLPILEKDAVFHTGDLVIYGYSHIEIYVDDLPRGSFTAIGYNTNAAGSRDGDGCFEKARTRKDILAVIRLLP